MGCGGTGVLRAPGRLRRRAHGPNHIRTRAGRPHWPWGDLDVYVVGSARPAGTPDRVVVDDDPVRLLERLRTENRGGDVHLVGGPRTVDTYMRLGALDELRLLVLPVLTGEGRRLTPEVAPTSALRLAGTREWPSGVVELVYDVERAR